MTDPVRLALAKIEALAIEGDRAEILRLAHNANIALAAVARDAARYRWLRAYKRTSLLCDFFGNGCVNRSIDEVDAAIDAAMASPVRQEET